jgi:UDP-glucose 4-epimerase
MTLHNTILITGGAGFIGSHVGEELLSAGKHLIILDDFSSGQQGNVDIHDASRIELVNSSLLDCADLDSILRRVDGVVHLAAQVSPPVSIQKPRFSMQQNIESYIHLLEAIKNVNPQLPLVYASSAAIYGDQDGQVCNEDAAMSPPKPTSHYGLEKWNLEHYAALYYRLYKLNSVGLRFFNVFGERQDPSSQYSGVISKFMDAANNHGSIKIFGDGQQTRDFIYVKDVARAIINGLSPQEGANVYNVATGRSISLIELYQGIERIYGLTFNVEFNPPRLGDIVLSRATNQKGLNAGILPRSFVSLDEGLSRIKHYATRSMEAV